jgi:hypothetical protein
MLSHFRTALTIPGSGPTNDQFNRSHRRGDRSRSRERSYDHSYGRSERDKEAEFDQYAAFGGYGYASYGMYPAAPYGVPVPGLMGDACFVCGGIGHIALDCPSKETLQRGRAGGFSRLSREREVEKCFECGKQGHQAREVRRGSGKRTTAWSPMQVLGSEKGAAAMMHGKLQGRHPVGDARSALYLSKFRS